MTHTPSLRRPDGFTLTEHILVMMIVIIVIALVFPLTRSAYKASMETKCLGNIRLFGNAVLLYAAENGGLPDKREENTAAVRFTNLLFPKYLQHKTPSGRYAILCPLANADDRKKPMGMEYAVNAALCAYFPKLNNIPAPASKVVLVSEDYYDYFNSYLHLNMTIWGARDTSVLNAEAAEANEGELRTPQYHGSGKSRGLFFFFLDGHAALTSSTGNNWLNQPTYGNATNGGYFYDRQQFYLMSIGSLVVK